VLSLIYLWLLKGVLIPHVSNFKRALSKRENLDFFSNFGLPLSSDKRGVVALPLGIEEVGILFFEMWKICQEM